MASKTRTATGLALSLALVITALALAGGTMLFQIGALAWLPLNGFGASALVPTLGLMCLTLINYALALILPHGPLALWQAIAMTVYGVLMIIGGGAAIAAGLASFAGYLALLFAFPFGTIAYFAKYTCGDGGASADVLGSLAGGCLAGMQIVVFSTLLLKALAYGVLLIASHRFIKVKGLIWATGFTLASGTAIVGLASILSSLTIVLLPADALLSAILGLLVLIYGAITAFKSLLAVALAIAGLAG